MTFCLFFVVFYPHDNSFSLTLFEYDSVQKCNSLHAFHLLQFLIEFPSLNIAITVTDGSYFHFIGLVTSHIVL